ncbi:MAG: hypothetical protein V7776_16150 [Halopseudomonas aestusnigri]
MKITNKSDFGVPALDVSGSVSVDGRSKSLAPTLKKVDVKTGISVQKLLKPFTGDLRSLGITEKLKELFDAARLAAESGRILPRGSFLNITV